MSKANDVLMVGLSDTGKSTFIAALYVSIKSTTTSCRLSLNKLGNDREYLEKLASLWIGAQKIERTTGTAEPVELILRDNRDENRAEIVLRMPDMSGETYRDQFESRQWTQDFLEKYAGAQSTLLFVRDDAIEEGISFAEIQHAERGLDDSPNDNAKEPRLEHVREWTISNCCTQVKIVDLLQFLAREKPLPQPRRLALIVSAWDLLDGIPPISPNKWLSTRMGLLDQYLKANPNQFKVEVFGVSAQGFDYKNDDAAQRLEEIVDSSERIRVLRGESIESTQDITLPIQWLLETGSNSNV